MTQNDLPMTRTEGSLALRPAKTDLKTALRSSLAMHKDELKDAVDEFKRATAALDPRRRIMQDPVGMLLGAFFVGAALGILLHHRDE